MRKKFIRYLILSIVLISSSDYLEAKKVSGFIITEFSDTIYGTIRMSEFNLLTGGWIFHGINLAPFHFEVSFRKNKNERFRNFQAGEILEFGFTYKSIDYYFHSFILESNSIFKNERRRHRFLQLCYKGKISLYKNVSQITTRDYYINTSLNNYHQYYDYCDYYLFNKNLGLTKVEITKNIKTINDLLFLYGIEEEFLERIPIAAKLKDIKAVLMKYEVWLYKKEYINLAQSSRQPTAI